MSKAFIDGKMNPVSLEDRISKVIWFENITLPDRIVELKRSQRFKRNASHEISDRRMEPFRSSFWHPFPRMQGGII